MRGRVTRDGAICAKKSTFDCFDEASPIIEKAIQLRSPIPILDPGSDCFRSLVTMSYQWDSRGYPFAARRTNNKLYVTTTVRQNSRRHRREWPLACLGKINLRWFNTTFFFSGNIKICHIVIVDNSCDGRSISASKSVEKHTLILHCKSYRLSIFLAGPGFWNHRCCCAFRLNICWIWPSVKKQMIFCDTTSHHWFPAKYSLRNVRRNSIPFLVMF